MQNESIPVRREKGNMQNNQLMSCENLPSNMNHMNVMVRPTNLSCHQISCPKKGILWKFHDMKLKNFEVLKNCDQLAFFLMQKAVESNVKCNLS